MSSLSSIAFSLIGLITHFTHFVPMAQAAHRGPVDSPDNWPRFNRTLDSQRFSPLGEINKTNVSQLKTKCIFDLGQKLNFQNGPIVINEVMYITTENDTYAINAATCDQVWKYHRNFTTAKDSLHVNRGAAFANGRIFRGSNDGFLIALDAKTGKLVWETKIAEPTAGESIPAVPVVWNNLVYIGQAGGDNVGVKGRMMAFRESDGQRVWSFELVPMNGPGSETWPEPTPMVPRTGGATWTSYTIDETNGLLLVPTGNAAPDFIKSLRPGTNLYTNSVVILDAKTGALKTWYQVTKDDFHDWDVASAPVLYYQNQQRKGKKGQMIAEAGKDGLLHLIDLELKAIVSSTETTARSNIQTPITTIGTRFCPGTQGGSEWNGAAYHPTLHTLYVPAVDWCTTVKLSREGLPLVARAGDPFTGAAAETPFGTMDPKSNWQGWLTAFHADNGTLKWRYRAVTPLLAPATPTAGNLVFTGDLEGNFLAFDGETGRLIFRLQMGEPIGGGIITYRAGGQQLIAVAAGMKSGIWQTKTRSSRVVILGL